MSKQTRTWLVCSVGAAFLFGLGFVARGAVDRYRATDTDAALTVDGNDFTLRGSVPEHLMLSCTMLPKSDTASSGSEQKLSSAPCYPVEALAPAVAHKLVAEALHTSVEALMGVEKCP